MSSRSPGRPKSGGSSPSRRSENADDVSAADRGHTPVAQWRSHKLEPIILQPKTPRPHSGEKRRGAKAQDAQLPAVVTESQRPQPQPAPQGPGPGAAYGAPPRGRSLQRGKAGPKALAKGKPRQVIASDQATYGGSAVPVRDPEDDAADLVALGPGGARDERGPGERGTESLQQYVQHGPPMIPVRQPQPGPLGSGAAAVHMAPALPNRADDPSSGSPSPGSRASRASRPPRSGPKSAGARSARSSSYRPTSPGTSPESRQVSTRPDQSRAPSASQAASLRPYGKTAPANRMAKYGGVKKGKTRVSVPPAALQCLGQVAAGIREMNWPKMYRALEILTRFLMPCECVTLYLVEEGGRYLRRVNTFLDAVPPDRRGPSLQPVSENTLEGACAMKAEPCSLPVRSRIVTKAQVNWASCEATGVYPIPNKGTFNDLSCGGCRDTGDLPTVSKIRNVLAFPLCFGSPQEEDPFGDYASVDTEHALADERVFGVLKLTNRMRNGRGQQLHLTSAKDRAEQKYQPFSKRDTELLDALTEFLREVYFSIDPVTFGPRNERSLDLRNDEDFEPLNAPSMMSGASAPSRPSQSGGSRPLHRQSGSRLLSHVQSGGSAVSMAAGMFGILGNAFAKGTSHRRAELPDLVERPEVYVTSDSSEAISAAPGWVFKEWTDEDLDLLGHQTVPRRIGGISLLTTWRLKEDVKVDPYCAICRFQIRVARTSRLGNEQAIWKEAQPFFCVSAEENVVSAFLSDFLRYGEEYIVSVRAGSADRWSEWSAPSEPRRLKAMDLDPGSSKLHCELLPHRPPSLEAFALQEHMLHFAFPAFQSFDSRSPLPVEYYIEAWQRQDLLGAAALEALEAYSRCRDADAVQIPGAGPEWQNAAPIFVATVKSDEVHSGPVECQVDVRKTALVPRSHVYFSVKARYLSLPLETNFSPKLCWTSRPVLIPELFPSLPAPEPVLARGDVGDVGTRGRTLEGTGCMVLNWPFGHPMQYCEDEKGDWSKGPFLSKLPPGEFPLPFRVQCRTLASDNESHPPRWSEWREVEAYEFVKPQSPKRQPSQHLAGRWANQGQFMASLEGELEEEQDCLDPTQDPLGVLSDWALGVSGLDLNEGSAWSGLTQLRWVSSTVEGMASAPSPTLCAKVAQPCKAPEVEHLVVNCSSSSLRGRRDQIDEEVPVLEEEQVIYELRHVAKVAWQLETKAPSFSFVAFFQIRYKEVPPEADARSVEWQLLPLTPLKEAVDRTDLDRDVLANEQRARFSYEVTSVPLLRFHRYIFAVQVLSHEHGSPWSPSASLHLVLPEVLPPKADEASTEEGTSEEETGSDEHEEAETVQRETCAEDERADPEEEGNEEERLKPGQDERPRQDGEEREPAADGQKDSTEEPAEENTGEEAAGEEREEEGGERAEETSHGAEDENQLRDEAAKEEVRPKKKKIRKKTGRVKLFDAEIQCDGEDASTWKVELRWRPFPLGGEAFPALLALPGEFQVSYYVLSERPSAESKDSAMTFGPLFVEGSAVDRSIDVQRAAGTVCLEGFVGPEEKVVIRALPRIRLPPLRCDVRLFLASRCMATTGPMWSKECLYVDLCLPRQAQLPLPVPQQLSCLGLLQHGLHMDIGTRADVEPDPDGFWAVLKIENFPRELVLAQTALKVDESIDLLELGSPKPNAHYVLQYRSYHPDTVAFSSASARPLDEEQHWREVPLVKALGSGGRNESSSRVFLAAKLDGESLKPIEATTHRWAKFRLASRKWSHFSFASVAAPVSPLRAPAKPQWMVEWVDSPSLDGLRLRVSAQCDVLTQAYQLRFRLSKDDAKDDKSWQLCDVVPLKLEELGEGAEEVVALAPTHRLSYHSEYHFSIRTSSLSRFSPWSEDSAPFRVSLEHQGMCQDESGVEIDIYGQEERHNCRCSVADVSWMPLALPVEQAPDVSIEYRVRWRKRLVAYNDAAALFGALDELRSVHAQGDEWKGRREEADGVAPVRLMVPDPDQQLEDIAQRGYMGDCTKRFWGAPEFSPWQLAAVVRAKVGPNSVERCSYALTFLQPDTDYEVQIDWRWQRLGDRFWMPAYPVKSFRTPMAPQALPPLRPLRILPQVWDEHEQLRSLCNLCQAKGQRLGRGFGLFQWPFTLAPGEQLAAKGQQLLEEWRAEPGRWANFMVQCRRNAWAMCQVALLDIAGKPACFAFAPPEQPLEEQVLALATDEPKPTNWPEIPQLDGDEMEFRFLRGNDCEVSEVLRYPALPLEPPMDVTCRLKMTEPHSTFGVSISFHGHRSLGFNSVPEEFQLLLQEVEGKDVVKEQLLPPERLPLSRVAEAFPEALQRPDFLCSLDRAAKLAARSGGQRPRKLEELEFEGFVKEVTYGKSYRLSVRWISKFKVSPWSVPAEIQVSFPPPSTTQEALLVGHLPDAAMSAELAGEQMIQDGFSPPSLWHRFEVSWQPFVASLWGSRMEYRLERRSLLHDRREKPKGILPEIDAEDLETSPWELVGQVMAGIEDATGKGCFQLTNCARSLEKAAEEEPTRSSQRDEARELTRCVLDSVYQSHADHAFADTTYGRRRLGQVVRRMAYAGAGTTMDEPENADELEDVPVASVDAPDELHFHVEELPPSVTYQFRLFARLHFHPSSGHEGEWSLPLVSAWQRTAEVVPQPPAPLEAVAPDPPPAEMLDDGTVLLVFPQLPGREGGEMPRPAPFQLQFRGALEPSTADWHLVESKPLDDDPTKILVVDSRLCRYAEDGVVFRLWRPQRCRRFGSEPGHRVEDDARVRHYTSLSSVASVAIRSCCAQFDEWPKATLVFQSSADLHKEDPPPTAMLRLDWKVHVPSNLDLMPVRLHQVRFRRVKPLGKDDSWQELQPFERYVAPETAELRREIPLVGPNFLIGADYEVCVRMATSLRWGNWSPPVPVSLAMYPPQPAVESFLQLEDVSLEDGATIFRLTWPAFDTHPLCNLVEYRIRMQRVSHYRYMDRLSEEIKARAKESFGAQEKTHVVGTIRVRVPQQCGPAKGFGVAYKERERETIEFVHRVPGDAEFGYRFFVDAKHERYREVDGQQDAFLKFAGEQEDWSAALESRESIVPPMPRNSFVPEQVPLDADPDPDQLRVTYPLRMEEVDLDRLVEAQSLQLLLFAPWKVATEASRWPHRVEYSPYLPDNNGGRLPLPGDVSEDRIDWHLPENVEYFYEAESHAPSGNKGPEQCAFVLAKGFDENLWETEMARQALHREQTKALGLFARIRVVREGGPEGMQLLSSPSRPLRLSMPTVRDLNVSVWSSNGRFCALLWWPSIVALCAEKDKNLDMSGQLHQVRLRRPDYEHDAGWIESQVKRSLPPVTIRRSCGAHSPHGFDLCQLLDETILPEELHSAVLPRQAFGAFRNEDCMTYEFSVRVSDGYRWSDWSPASARCCFAVEPKIVTTAPVELDELHRALTEVPDVVTPATSVDLTKPLAEQLTFTHEGDMEPPHWVAIAKPPETSDVLSATARLSQFLVSWPNLPPSAYSQPDPEILPAVKQMSESGDLPPFLAPPLLYRINVWMVSLSPDAADADQPQAAWNSTLMPDELEADGGRKDLLYRQYDVPPSAYPDPVDYDEPTVTRLSWHLPTLPPDKTYRCTIEGRFETNTSVHWWTPLMRSEPFVVERVPPPAPPELVPVAELPTPEQQKLSARLAPHSNAWLVVRWPWRVQGRHVDILKDSSHVLEFCRASRLQSLRDPSTEPVNIEGETAMKGRALGPWREAKALQICFAHFVKNEVHFELPAEAANEANWVPVLVASGLWPAEGEAEPESVHLRWRYRAGLKDLAQSNASLHFSAASGPVRTMIAMPGPVEVYMAVPERASRLSGFLHWNAWRGSEKHQFSYRILSKQRKSKRHVRGLLSESESTDTLEEAKSSTPKAAQMQAITGWIELPPVFDEIKRKLEVEVANQDAAELLISGEAGRISSFQRKLSGTEWQRVLWRHYHQKQEEFWDSASRDGDHEASWQFSSSLTPAHSTGALESTERSSLGGTKTRDVPFRIRPTHALEWRVRVSDGTRWSDWSSPSEAAQLAPPIPKLAGPVRLIFNRREPTVVKVVWSACEVLEDCEHLMDSIEYLVFMAIDENSGRELIQDEGSFDVNRLHNWGVHLSDGSCGRLLPYLGEEGEAVVPFDFEGLFSDASQKRLLGKFRHKEMRTISAEGDGGPPTVQGFELHVSGLKPHCMHRISVCVRCAVENLPEPDWQRVKLDPTHPLRWSEPFHSSPLLTPLRPPPMLVPELVPIPDGRFGRFLHTPCILLKCAMFAKQNKNDSDKDHSVVVDCRPAGSTDEDYQLVPSSIYCEPVEYGPCRLVYNLPYLHAEIRTRNVTMNDVSAASIPFFAVPPLTIEDSKGPTIRLVVGKEGTLCVRVEWTSRCLPGQKPKLLQIGVRRHAIDQGCVEQASQSVLPHMCLEELPTSALSMAEDFEGLMQEAAERFKNQGGILRDESPYYCRHCFQPLQRKASESPTLGPLGTAWIAEVKDVLKLSAVALDEIGVGNPIDTAALRAPHWAQLEQQRREEANPWEAIRQAKAPCCCRDVFCCKEMHVDGEELVHGTVYTFRLRVSDGQRWSCWTEYSPPMQVVIPPPKPPVPYQETLQPTPPPTVEVVFVKDEDDTIQSAVEGLKGPDIRLRLRWPRFEGRMQEVEYRILMWTLTPEQRKRAVCLEKGPLPPIVGMQSVFTSSSFPGVTAQVDESSAPRIVRPVVPDCSPVARAKPRTLQPGAQDTPEILAHIQPFDPPDRGGRSNELPPTLEAEVNVMPVPKGHGYVFAVEAKHCRGALGNLGEWSPPMFSRFVEFQHQSKELSLEVDARFGTLLFKGQAATQPKPKNEKLQMEANAVSFVDEHRDLPKAMPLLTNPGGDPWPIGASPKKFIMRTKGRTVYAERLDDEKLPELPEARPRKDDFREG